MRKNCLLAVPVFLVLLCTTGCVVNRAISANAVADNLAVEKAQNEMLLLNVLRGKDHRPMYVTGISKITGSIKAEASLNASVPFGSVQGDRSSSLGTPYYVASPTATYNWNPSFDVNVLDTSDFMGGFLAPVSGDIFAYYWHLGYFPEFLLHLMVLKVEVKVKSEVCEQQKPGSKLQVDEYIIRNNHEAGAEPLELERFTEWVSNFLTENPHFGVGKADPLGPLLTEEEARRALVRGLPQGLTLTQVGQGFQFQRTERPPFILKLDGKTVLKDLYSWISNAYKSHPAGGIELHHHNEVYSAEVDAKLCPTPGSDAADDISAKASEEGFTESGLIKPDDDSHLAKMTITLYLRSPEAILYYLGELARFEEVTGNVLYVCMHDKLEPLFVVSRSAECKSRSVVATTGEGVTYFIPGPEEDQNDSCDQPGAKKFKLLKLSCDPGRSLHSLAVLSQLVALQKSAKDLPTTSVVRVVGQ